MMGSSYARTNGPGVVDGWLRTFATPLGFLGVARKELDLGGLAKILMLTLLVSNIFEPTLDGPQPAELGVHVLREGFSVDRAEQRATAFSS